MAPRKVERHPYTVSDAWEIIAHAWRELAEGQAALLGQRVDLRLVDDGVGSVIAIPVPPVDVNPENQ